MNNLALGLKNLYRYREMIRTTISKELKARYKGSVLGFLWTFVNPLLQLAVYSIAFKYIMRISVPGVNYTLFLFVGLTVWACFSSALIMGSTVFVANGNLIKKIYFPRIVLPISSVSGNIINFALVFGIVLPILWIFGYPPNLYYLFLPLLFIILWLLCFGFVLILSSAYVYFRDLEHLLNVILMATMYLTPIIYSDDFFPGVMYHVLKLNPMFGVVTSFQRILMYNQEPDLWALSYVFAFSLAWVLVGYVSYKSMQRRFAEEI
jgi:ABC-2 type transport system permease protein